MELTYLLTNDLANVPCFVLLPCCVATILLSCCVATMLCCHVLLPCYAVVLGLSSKEYVVGAVLSGFSAALDIINHNLLLEKRLCVTTSAEGVDFPFSGGARRSTSPGF